MRVLHLVNDFSHGGAESYVFSLLKEALGEELNFGVGLLYDCDSEINRERLLFLSQSGLDYFVCSGSFRFFLKGIKKFSPDVVHCHNLKALIFSALSLFLLKKRYRIVFTQHTSYLKRKLFHRILHKLVDRYVAICNTAVDDFCKVVPEHKVIKLMNGVAQSGPGDASLHVPGKCNVGMIARFHKVKNHRMLIDAAEFLKENGELDKFRFFLIGDGEERKNVEEMVQVRGFGESIKFLGALSNAKNYLDSFDYLLLCSTNEGLPITVLESLEKNTPVIATRVGGVPDLISDGVNGYLVKSDDPKGLAQALIKAAETGSLESFNLYFERNEFLYSMDKILIKHVSIYDEILRDGACCQ